MFCVALLLYHSLSVGGHKNIAAQDLTGALNSHSR